MASPFVTQPSQAGAEMLSVAWSKPRAGAGRGKVVYDAEDMREVNDDRVTLLGASASAASSDTASAASAASAGGDVELGVCKYRTLEWLPGWARALMVVVGLGMLAAMLWYTITYTFASRARKNVIFLISDGFGPASQTMARQYVQSTQGKPMDFQLPLDTILVGSSRTRSTDSLVTDSAAGATAFSCGLKSYNGAIAVDSRQLPCATVLEGLHVSGYRTGLVATSRITHATPASFASHVVDRDLENDIAVQEIGNTPLGVRPDILFGGGRRHFIPKSQSGSSRTDDVDVLKDAQSKGYRVITTRSEFDALPRDATGAPTLAVFTLSDMTYEIDRDPAVEPSLLEMAKAAIDILEAQVAASSSDGFFLMIEGSRIDHAAHDNDPATHLGEILMYNEVIEYVRAYIDAHPDTIMVSTSDHECGGMTVARQVQVAYPDYLWYPAVLSGVHNSTSALSKAIRAYAAGGGSDLEAYITQVVVRDMGITDMSDAELQTLMKLALSSDSNAQQNLVYALGIMESTRAQLGWTTHGHSGVDVNLYAYGSESVIAPLRGNHENTDVGQFFISYFDVDLAPLTERLINARSEGKRGAAAAAGRTTDDVHHARRV